VKKEDVIGKVVAVIPYMGYLGYFVRTPIGFAILITMPATILIILEIREIIKETKRKQQQKLEGVVFLLSRTINKYDSAKSRGGYQFCSSPLATKLTCLHGFFTEE